MMNTDLSLEPTKSQAEPNWLPLATPQSYGPMVQKILHSDVQSYLSFATPWETLWTSPWTTPPVPWNDHANFATVATFREGLQDFTLWWQTQTDWPVSSRSRQSPMSALSQALEAACALQIALSHGLAFPQGVIRVDPALVGRLASQDTNLLFGLGADDSVARQQAHADFAKELQRLRNGIVDVIRWMAWDDWHPLLGAESGGLYVQTKARWTTLMQTYMAWFQQDAAIWERLPSSSTADT